MTKQINQWRPLKAGDTIDIIAPASASTSERLEFGLDWLRSLGLIPRFSDNLIQTDLFFASSLDEQWRQLEKALHSDSKAIWCLRGGYGSMRLIPFLEKINPPPSTKLFIGFSDITALHIYFNQRWNWPTVHGRTISQLQPDWGEDQNQQLEDLIFGKVDEVKFQNLIPMNKQALESKVLKAPVVGGNLRLIENSLSTPWEIQTKGKIVFIEDVSERGYAVDRMLEHLHQSGHFNQDPLAVVIGDFTQGQELDGKNLIPEALQRFADRVNYPVLKGLPCGHAKGINSPLPFNTSSTLILGHDPHLICKVNC